MILWFDWCKKHRIKFQYLDDNIEIHETQIGIINMVGKLKESEVKFKVQYNELFQPLQLAKHWGALNFAITLKK
jgi:hypothetical protein